MIDYYLEQLKSLKYLADFEADLSNGYVTFKRHFDDRIDNLVIGSLRDNRVYVVGCGIGFIPIENLMMDYEGGEMGSTVSRPNHNHMTGYDLGSSFEKYFPINLDSKVEVDKVVLLVHEFLE